MIEKWKQALLSIQWITNSSQYNERQLIQLGDAIAAFHDCLELCERYSAALERIADDYIDGDSLIGVCPHNKTAREALNLESTNQQRSMK